MATLTTAFSDYLQEPFVHKNAPIYHAKILRFQAQRRLAQTSMRIWNALFNIRITDKQ